MIEHTFPSGLSHDEYYIIKEKGICKPDGLSRGDLHLLIKIVTPNLEKNRDLKSLLERMHTEKKVNDKIKL